MVPSVRDAWKKAMNIDACFDHGGPPRNLGELYAKAPPWPASIGDPDKGVELVGQAIKCAADWPQNNLFLGDALCAAEKYDEAEKQYQIVMSAQPRPEDPHFLPKWKGMAKKGTEDCEKKKQAAISGTADRVITDFPTRSRSRSRPRPSRVRKRERLASRLAEQTFRRERSGSDCPGLLPRARRQARLAARLVEEALAIEPVLDGDLRQEQAAARALA